MPTTIEAEAVPSPCIGVCTIADGRCRGCGRTLDEITQWGTAAADEQAAILIRARGRFD